MPGYNGSGTYQRFRSWEADAAAGVKIRADYHDDEDDGFAAGLSNAICRDGQSTITQNIPFNAKRITGLANPVDAQDAVTKAWLLDQGLFNLLRFPTPDMSIIGRVADGGATPPTKNRIAYNDKVDGTGNDVFWINDDGTVSTKDVTTGTVYAMARKTADTRNRIVNGAIQISQENGTTPVTVSGNFMADQWQAGFVSSSAITMARSIASGAQPYYVYVVASPAETAAAAGEVIRIQQTIEGIRLNDLGFGVASKQTVIAFDVNVPVAGTYWVALVNNAASHSWLGSYTISAAEVGAFVRKSVVIPAGAINAGVWPTDTTRCATLAFTFHCGATYTGVAGFQAGNFYAGPGQVLGLSTAAACVLSNVGLYLDPDKTGVAPPWQMPDEAEELRACQRYWQTTYVPSFYAGLMTTVSSIYFPVQYLSMRANPSISGGSLTSSVYDTAGAVSNATSFVTSNVVNGSFNIQASRSGGMTGLVARGYQLSARL